MTTAAELVVDMVPSRAGAATQVLAVCDDPNSGASDLARAVGADPALASRTLGLANSAYFGLSGRVATLEFAVSLVGFNTVRALALTLAAGLDRPGAVPDHFWEQSATCAAAASVLAPRYEASAPEAFCLGLLHTIGSALLHQVRPLPALCLPFPADPAALAAQETELYGCAHAELGAKVLARWNFPPTLCAVIAHHHDDLRQDATPLARVLQAARVCADTILREGDDGGAPAVPTSPAAQRTLEQIQEHAMGSLLEQIRAKAEPLRHSLSSPA